MFGALLNEMRMHMQIKKRLKQIFESVGIYLDDDELDDELEIDSLQFVAVIVGIENEFLIRISNDFEDYSSLVTFNDFYNLVSLYFEDVK